MRKILFILLMLPVLCLSAQKVDDIFTIAADGTIQTKPVYYNEVKFDWTGGGFKDVFTTTFRTQDQTPYTIQLRKWDGELKANVFNQIEIKYNNQTIYSIMDDDLWRDAALANGRTCLYEVIPLSQTTSALLFFGWSYGGDPALLTIVVVNKGKAKLVFNRYCDILSYEDKNGAFSLIYTPDTQEIPYEGAPLEPADDELNKFKIWKTGGVLKFQKIQ